MSASIFSAGQGLSMGTCCQQQEKLSVRFTTVITADISSCYCSSVYVELFFLQEIRLCNREH
jgi:hypothetical protein